MASCEFCNAEGQKAGQCAYCGTGKYTSGASFIYGKKEGEACACEFTLTDKYLIVRPLSAGETMGMAAAGAAFGVLGVLTAAAVNAEGVIHHPRYHKNRAYIQSSRASKNTF